MPVFDLLTELGRDAAERLRDRLASLYHLGGPCVRLGPLAPYDFHGQFIVEFEDPEDDRDLTAFLADLRIVDRAGLAALLRLERVEAMLGVLAYLGVDADEVGPIATEDDVTDLAVGERPTMRAS